MYMIRHIPSKTFYGITDKQGKFSLVGFKRMRDAKHVADSVATYKLVHKEFPIPSPKVYVMEKKQITGSAADAELWIEDHRNTIAFLRNLGKHNMDFNIIEEIDGLEEDKVQIKGRTLYIQCPTDLYKETLLHDLIEEN